MDGWIDIHIFRLYCIKTQVVINILQLMSSTMACLGPFLGEKGGFLPLSWGELFPLAEELTYLGVLFVSYMKMSVRWTGHITAEMDSCNVGIVLNSCGN